MKRVVLLLGCVLMVFAWSSASADIYSLTDTTLFTSNGTINPGDLDGYGRGTVNKLDGIGDYVAWTHNFAFNPPASDLITASLAIRLTDNDNDCLWNTEWAVGKTESGQWAFGEIDTGIYKYNINVNYLADGAFSVMVASIYGDFYINSSELNISYNSVSVPEPSILIMLGLGLLVIGFLASKKERLFF